MEKEKTFCALAAGFILFTASFFLLFINEFNYANTLQIANFVEKNAIQVSSKNINPSNENKAVYMTGKVSSQQTLTDSIISIPSAIALFRDTEMYQWEEIKQHKSSQKSSYEYRKIWSKKLIDSDKFKNNTYNNPKKMKYKAENLYADNVSLGDFYLSNEITEKINSITKITQLPYNPELKIYNGFYFTGTNYDTPSIGDKKLSYSYIPSEIQVSVIARQTGNRLESIDNKYGSLVIIMNGEKIWKKFI